MPPFLRSIIQRSSLFQPGSASEEFLEQWTHPGDVFSVLLILGGDVVGRALAQITGEWLPPPSFSFGWVAYSVVALVSALGENKLMPEPDCKCLAINGKSGYKRTNSSWVIGRIVRDFEKWRDVKVEEKLNMIIEEKWADLKERAQSAGKPEPKKPTQAGLCISIYKPAPNKTQGQLSRDGIYFLGFFIAILQLGIAAIPCGIFGDWGILIVTACGICLSCITAALPQWKSEKWACRRLEPDSEKRVILTRGNGSQHAIVILPAADALDLEDLAGGESTVDASVSIRTRFFIGFLTVLWILLLISAAGLKDNTWFLLAVGAVGILYNSLVAGYRRDPSALGVPLEFVNVIGAAKVMSALQALEEAEPYLGMSLVPIFFPGKLRPEEQSVFSEFERTVASRWEDRKRKSQGTSADSTVTS